MPPVSDALEPGTILRERYLVEFVLGQGGMGAVYFARDQQRDGEPVAVKEMRVQAMDPKIQAAAVKQFRQEAEFLRVLDHPNLVKVFDFFHQEGRYYLVMSYVKGRSLADILSSQKEFFPQDQLLEWVEQLVDVLCYLHSRNPPILFRDVKPSNIIVDSQAHLHLIDFGIARALHPDEVTASFLQGMGSVDYCPLEQYQGIGGTDQRTDIYALGATLYHLLTLQLPPRAGELAAENRKAPSPRLINPGVEPALEELVVNMMAVHKHDRYGSMEQVRSTLKKARRNVQLRQERAAAVKAGVGRIRQSDSSGRTAPRTGNRATTLLLGVLSVVLVGLLVWLVRQS